MVTILKTCFKCLQEKPICEFYRHKMMADGHLGKCKECAKADTRENRAKNADYYNAYDSMRNSQENRKRPDDRDAREYKSRWREKNQHAIECHTAVRSAIKDGILTKPNSCTNCFQEFEPRKIHAHHPDYSKPLNVVWLCHRCHSHEHKKHKQEFTPKRKLA